MPIHSAVPGDAAFATTLANAQKKWPASERDPESAGSRFKAGGYFRIAHRPRFSLSPDDVVFTIGSCFARNVEEKLIKQKVSVVTSEFSLPPEFYVEPRSRPNAALNKYSVASIYSELESVLNGRADHGESFIELSDGLWTDPHASGTKPCDFETALGTRSKIAATTRRISECSVVFITLGLTESWVDNTTGLVLNSPPPFTALRRHKGRFSWFNHDYQDCLDTMENILQLVWTKCRSDMRFVVTVSPVPLQATFSGRDIVTANTYSKSTLRSVCDRLAQKFDLVDYFPSYEMVMNSPRDMAWIDDQVHVADKMVEFVIGRFCEYYITETSDRALQ